MSIKWTAEQDTGLLKLGKKYLSEGLKTKLVFEKVCKELDISTPSACRARYYLVLNGGGTRNNSMKRLSKNNIEDKKRIIEIVLETIENGGLVKDGLKKASKELGYSYNSCKGQWEKSNVNKTRERTDWVPEEDDKLINIIVDENKKGITINHACKIAARELHRTYASCMSRWMNELRDKYIDKVELVTENWNEEEKLKMLEIISIETNTGNTLENAFKIAGEKLDRTASACGAVYNKYRQSRLEYDIKTGSWLIQEEQKLKEIILDGTREGKEINYLLNKATKELGRTLKSVRNKWYYTVLPKCKEDYAKIRIARNGRLKFGESKARNIWTVEEDKILLDSIENELKKGKTLRTGFIKASKILVNRTETSCSLRYYNISAKRKLQKVSS